MFKSLAVLALGVAIGGCATQQSPASAANAQPVEAQAKPKTHRVCKMVQDEATETKINRRQECHEVVDAQSSAPKAN